MIYYDIKRYFFDFKNIILMLVIPLIMLLLLFYTISPFFYDNLHPSRFSVAVVDYDNTLETRFIINHFEQAESLKQIADVIRTDYEEAVRMIKDNKIAAMIVVPKNFSNDLRVGKNTPVTVIGNQRMSFQALLIKEYMKNGANLVTAAQSGVNTIWSFLHEAGASKEDLNKWFSKSVMEFTFKSLGRNQVFKKRAVSPIAGILPFEYYSIAIMVIYIFFNSMVGLRLMIQEKKAETIKRMTSQGVPSSKIVVSKFLALLIFQTIQFSVLFMIMIIFFNQHIRGDMANAIGMFILTIAACSSCMMVLAALFGNFVTANVAGYTIVLVMAFVGGSIIPLPYLPEAVRSISFISINKWAVNGLIYSIFWDKHEIVFQCLFALIAFIAVFLLLAIGVLKRNVRCIG